MPEPLEGRVVRLALRQGFIDQQQAQQVLAELDQPGVEGPAEELLHGRGWIDDQQREVLRQRRIQGSRPGSSKTTTIADFEVIREIGQGAMGTVYLARQRRMDRHVALKVLSPEHVRDEQYVRRFLREAKSSGKINHENIVAGIDVGKWKNTYYFAQEYVDGTSVDELVYKLGTLDETASLKIVLKVARALEHLSQHKVVHRDIKPENIMLTWEGAVKLCDFGLAKDMNKSSLTTVGTSVGTPHYISPEQARGESDIDVRADVYSLGVSLYHMLGGHPPFDTGSPYDIMVNHIKKPFPPLEHVGVQSETRELLGLMVSKKRERRLTPAQLVKRVAELVEEGPVVPDTIKPGREPDRPPDPATVAARPQTKRKKKHSSSHRARARSTSKTNRRAVPRRSGRGGLWAGVALVVLLAVANLVYLASRNSEPEPENGEPGKQVARPGPGPKLPPRKTPAQKALGALEQRLALMKRPDPVALGEIVLALEKLPGAHPGDPGAEQARELAARLRQRAQKAAVERWGALEEQAARRLTEGQEYAGIDLLRKVPDGLYFLPFGKRVARLREQLATAMNNRFAAAKQAAVAALQTTDRRSIEAALASLRKVADYGSPAQVKEAVGLAKALEKVLQTISATSLQQLQAAYEKQFRTGVLGHWRGRRYDEARKLLEQQGADPRWARLAGLIARDRRQTDRLAGLPALAGKGLASRVGKMGTFQGVPGVIVKVAEGQVEVGQGRGKPSRRLAVAGLPTYELAGWLQRGGLDPATAGGSFALALFFYAEGELATAERHLERAVGLGAAAEGLADRIAAAAPSDPEYAADQAYRKLQRVLPGKPPAEGIKLIDAFLARHGKSRLAERQRAELDKRRKSLEAELAKKPPTKKPPKEKAKDKTPGALELRPVKLKGSLRGRRRKDGYFDVHYWFKKASEAEDWSNEKRDAAAWRYDKGGLSGEAGGTLLWKPELHGDFQMTFKYRAPLGTDDLGLVFRSVDDPKKGYRLVVKASGTQLDWTAYKNTSVLQRLDPKPSLLDRTLLPERISKGSEHTIEIERTGGRFWVKLDGKDLLSGRDTRYGPVQFGVYTFYKAEARRTRITEFRYRGFLSGPKPK